MEKETQTSDRSPLESPHVSIWSVPADWRNTYLIAFLSSSTLIFFIVLGHEVWQGIAASKHWVEIAIRIGSAAAPLIFLAATLCLLGVELGKVLSESFVRKRYNEGKAAGKAEGKAEERRFWETRIESEVQKRVAAELRKQDNANKPG